MAVQDENSKKNRTAKIERLRIRDKGDVGRVAIGDVRQDSGVNFTDTAFILGAIKLAAEQYVKENAIGKGGDFIHKLTAKS